VTISSLASESAAALNSFSESNILITVSKLQEWNNFLWKIKYK
jgi:hypothetical protein